MANLPPPINISQRKRRYKLHQNIKDRFRYSALKRTVYIHWDDEVTDKSVIELRDVFGYNIQTEIR